MPDLFDGCVLQRRKRTIREDLPSVNDWRAGLRCKEGEMVDVVTREARMTVWSCSVPAG